MYSDELRLLRGDVEGVKGDSRLPTVSGLASSFISTSVPFGAGADASAFKSNGAVSAMVKTRI